MVFSPVFISHHPGRTMPQAAPLRNLSARRLPRLPRLCREASRGLGRGVRPPSLYSPVSLLESALTKRWGVGVRGIPVRILDSGELPWASAPGDAATDVLRRSPFLATHPRPPGVLCRSLGLIPFFPRHSPLATLPFHTCLLQSLCRACDGHTARVR